MAWKGRDVLQLEYGGIVFDCLFVFFERKCALGVLERHLSSHGGRRIGGSRGVGGGT